MELTNCNLCPRKCGADRLKQKGYCGAGCDIKIARAALHDWEEPCISGTNGSGTIFFSGCVLKCCFCQNYKISAQNFGKEISVSRLSEIFLELQQQGAHNINLVNPTQYVPQIIEALKNVKSGLTIPVVYNSGGYESKDTLHRLEGHIDIYLPDIKYCDVNLSKKYSGAPNYFEVASLAILEMYRQCPKIVLDENGILQQGVIIRHLVLPGAYEDSIRIIEWISEHLPHDSVLISLMSQYTPFFNSKQYPEINRRITTYEYEKVLNKVKELNLNGFMQRKSSAKEEYTPDFDLQGV